MATVVGKAAEGLVFEIGRFKYVNCFRSLSYAEAEDLPTSDDPKQHSLSRNPLLEQI